MPKKGYKQTEGHKLKHSNSKKGDKHPFYGKHHTIDANKRNSEAHKGNIPWNKNLTGIPNLHLKGKKLSEEHKKKLSEAHKGQIPWQKGKPGLRGDMNPAWKGGISFLPYCHKFNNELKERIRERDNRTCQLCGNKENNEKLTVHHIHHDRGNCYPNLISLCRRCHAKTPFNRKYYETLFMNNLNNRGLLFWSKV